MFVKVYQYHIQKNKEKEYIRVQKKPQKFINAT